MSALAPTIMIISGSNFHPLLILFSTSGLYLYIFVMFIVSYGVLLLQYVNSINYFIKLSIGFVGGGD